MHIGRAMWLLFRPESHPFPLHLLVSFKHVFTVERTCSMKYIQLIQLQRTVWVLTVQTLNALSWVYKGTLKDYHYCRVCIKHPWFGTLECS